MKKFIDSVELTACGSAEPMDASVMEVQGEEKGNDGLIPRDCGCPQEGGGEGKERASVEQNMSRIYQISFLSRARDK